MSTTDEGASIAGVVAILQSYLATGVGLAEAAREVAPHVSKQDLIAAIFRVEGGGTWKARLGVVTGVMSVKPIADSLTAAKQAFAIMDEAQCLDTALMPAVSAQHTVIDILQDTLLDTLRMASRGLRTGGVDPTCWMIEHLMHPEVLAILSKPNGVGIAPWLPTSVQREGEGIARIFRIFQQDMRNLGGMVLERLTIVQCDALESLTFPIEVPCVTIQRCKGLQMLDLAVFPALTMPDLIVQKCARLERIQGACRMSSLKVTDCPRLVGIPSGLDVSGDLDLSGCRSFAELPSDLKVGGNLILLGCQAWDGHLPDDIVIHGKVSSDYADVPMMADHYRLHMAGLSSEEDAEADYVGKVLDTWCKPVPWHGDATPSDLAEPRRDIRALGWLHGVDEV